MQRTFYFLLFLTIQVKAQHIVLFDSLTNKSVKIREGKLLGVITAKDTIDPYYYQDSTYRRGTRGYRPDGIWKLHKIDLANQVIQLKPRDKNRIVTYPLNDIKYFQYRKERDSRYRGSMLMIGTIGTLGGIVNLFVNRADVGYSIGLLSVGVISTAWVFGTSKRTELKKYTLVRLENK